MYKLHPISIAVAISLSVLPSLSYASRETSGNVVTISNQDYSTTLIEKGINGLNELHLENVHVNINGQPVATYPSGVSLAGSNALIYNGNSQSFGNQTMVVDRQSSITISNITGEAAAIYTRSDTQGATVSITSAATITVNNAKNSGTKRALGILAENLNSTLGTSIVHLTQGSNINIEHTNNNGAVVAVSNIATNTQVKTEKDTSISIVGSDSSGMLHGLYVHNSRIKSADIDNQGDITIIGSLTGTSDKHAIDVYATSRAKVVSSGKISVTGSNGAGIFTNSPTGTTEIKVSGEIEATGANSSAIIAKSSTGAIDIQIDSGTTLSSGSGDANTAAGILLNSSSDATQTLTIESDSTITSLNDSAIYVTNGSSGTTVTNNNGILTGYVNYVGVGSNTFNHSGEFYLQDFSTGTKSAITSDFGTNGIFNNSGLIAFSDKNFDGTLSTATLSNVATFDHGSTAVIDLRSHNSIGNTLTITNGGTGYFVSNGGSIELNTNVTTNGTSDKLIIDNASTGTGGSTLVYINPIAGSLYNALPGDGIEIIHVNGVSSSDAFKLGRPIIGVYEYQLAQGGASSTSSWFLKSTGTNPAVGGYLANTNAAMSLFHHSLSERISGGKLSSLSNTSKFSTFWMTTKGFRSHYRSVNGEIKNSDRGYTLQMGSDLGMMKISNGYFHFGVIGGYGDYKNTVTTFATLSKAQATMTGYNAGLYGSWFANKDGEKGLYLDLWSQYSMFSNHVENKGASSSTISYDSKLWSNSIELGYNFSLAKGSYYKWLLTPQAQFTYHIYDMDEVHDNINHLSVENGENDGLVTRLGMRLHGKSVKTPKFIQPFIEVNWLNSNIKNQLQFNGSKQEGDINKNILDAKIGLQSDISNRLSLSLQAGRQWGKQDFKRYQGEFNINYRF